MRDCLLYTSDAADEVVSVDLGGRRIIKKNLPIFGICLGHQILALTLGAKTKKMKLGHRGANHPVKNLIHDNVEITSQNHGFVVVEETLPKKIEVTHKSLFDDTIEGIRPVSYTHLTLPTRLSV